MLGYFFFGLTTLFYLALAMFNFPKPRLAGDAAMGYGLGIAFFALGLAVSSLLLMLHIAWKGGFDWVSPQGSTRNVIVGAGWLAMVAATVFCAVLRWEWHAGEFPQFIRWFALSRAEIWLPLLLLIPSLFLLNKTAQTAGLSGGLLLTMKTGFVLSVIIGAGLLFGWLRASAQNQAARMENMVARDIKLQQQHLEFIAEQTPESPIVNIIALTGRYHDKIVRDSAVSKIKSHADWEALLLKLLENEAYHTHVYTFIDGNKVDHPELFIQPLMGSIHRLAKEIKSRIVDSNNLQDWHFEHFGIERLLRAIDEQFLLEGADFRPAVLELQKALKTPPPERFKDVRFTVTPAVNAWLKAH